MTEHGWTRHGHSCCDQATGPRPASVARCGGPGLCGECSADLVIRHSPGSGTWKRERSTGPTQAAYEAASEAYEDGNSDHYSEQALNRAANAVWALARTQVAEEIRAAKVGMLGLPTAPLFAMELVTETAEWAARIAEGGGQ